VAISHAIVGCFVGHVEVGGGLRKTQRRFQTRGRYAGAGDAAFVSDCGQRPVLPTAASPAPGVSDLEFHFLPLHLVRLRWHVEDGWEDEGERQGFDGRRATREPNGALASGTSGART
jgi:hypothetical protein